MKKRHSFKFFDETNLLLDAMCEKHGQTRTAIIEYAIRLVAREGAFKLDDEQFKPGHDKPIEK